MKMIDVKVVEIVDETPTIKSFRFERVDGKPLGTYQAGAHVDVVGPTAVTRQYSLCSTPDDPNSYTVAVKREDKGRGGSSALHELAVGDVLQISEPRNLMGVDLSADHHVLMAAGIGVTPMLSMARWLDVHGYSFELHYYARSSEEAAFLPLLQERCPEKLHAHLGIAADEHEPRLRATMAAMPTGSHVYHCGPGPFMELVDRIAHEFLPDEKIHQESFQAAEQPDAAENTAFEVEFEDETYQIPPDKSIVEVLHEHDIEVDVSCQEGICGTCILSVLEGTPEHRDSVLTKAEKAANETIAVCVSRSKTPRLVLDWY
ncbi:PDR/VanB family oxidoreductase [Granulicoccus sp. GXG6511]|uniref:PDR/VanB family oxidoreductase n=1 Tax=Granulicoccus sp. GXG6511 TaxID=3381351 RepID=UPI003D7D3C7F